MTSDPALVKALFFGALDLPDPAERQAFLDRECGGDQELRRRLDVLLDAHDRPASEMGTSVGAGFEATSLPNGTDPPVGGAETSAYRSDDPQAAPMIGSIIAGRYKIREQIGEGGMGSVYLAEQLQPVKRRVALKLIKLGMDTRTVLARFETERQALALMDHPNIAKVLDAGSTDSGRPYFVMELVKGIPITEYCDHHVLGLPERLALFRQVCSAVQHAHQKGIIHRDLKPTNILVEAHDEKPVPKVIDFGLAKATSGMLLTDQSLFTAFGSVAGTPLYMAPEQASFNALDVDTRADIYALGVMLYELLTGSTPIRRETFQRAALDEMLRVIREDDPPTPSSRISTSDALPGLAATRHIEPNRLSRFMKGDLDWIVMKALAKDRQRRYDSAIDLANDIERFTNHEPVSAGPPSSTYRMRKFARRNRGQVVAASLLLLTLVGGVAGTTVGLVEARRQERVANRQREIAVAEAGEKEKARQAEAFQRVQAEKRLAQVEKANAILGSIFKDFNPKRAEREGKPLSALLEELLNRATTEIEGDSVGEPLTVARMQSIMGRSQLGLGNPDKAIELITKARATFASLLGPDHSDTLTSMNDLSLAYRDAGKIDRALSLLEEILTLRKAKLGPDSSGSLFEKNYRAVGNRDDGRIDRAIPLLKGELTLRKNELGPDHADTLTSMNDLAVIYARAGKIDLALPIFEEVLALRKEKLGDGHPDTLTTQSDLAMLYLTAGQIDRSLPLLERTLALQEARLGQSHPDTLVTLNRLGVGYRDAGRLEKALPVLEQTLALRKAKLRPGHPDTLTSMTNLAEGYQAAGQLGRATQLQEEVSALWKREAGADSWRYAFALASTGWCLLQEERWAEAESVLREALSLREAKEPDSWTTDNARSLLGWALLGQKRYGEAEPLLRTGYEGMKRKMGEIFHRWKKRMPEDLDRLILLAEATGKPDEAKAWREEKAKLSAP
jgi:serine/threonine protein kinase